MKGARKEKYKKQQNNRRQGWQADKEKVSYNERGSKGLHLKFNVSKATTPRETKANKSSEKANRHKIKEFSRFSFQTENYIDFIWSVFRML